MKKILFALALCGLMAMPALAAVQTFSKLKVDVADGWTASEEGPVVILLAPENAASLSIAYDSAGGLPGPELAKAMSAALGGTEPKQEDDTFIFTFSRNGNESECYLTVGGDEYVMFAITDPSGAFNDDIVNMIDSVEEK